MRTRGPRIPADEGQMPEFGLERDLSPPVRTARIETRHADAPRRTIMRLSTPSHPGKVGILTNPWLVWTAGTLICAFGFLGVLWLTEPDTPPRAIAILANSAVSDSASLMAAVQTTALRATPNVKGAINELRRAENGQVMLNGWVTDVTSGGSPLTVMAFADGRNVLTIATEGTRADVAQILGLSNQASANISFQARLPCERGHKLIVIAVTPQNMYGHFGSRVCP